MSMAGVSSSIKSEARMATFRGTATKSFPFMSWIVPSITLSHVSATLVARSSESFK